MTVDETMPDGKWAFDASVTDAFDDMLERSIPAYNVMRDLTTSLAAAHLPEGGTLVDLGCSRGVAIANVLDRFRGEGNRHYLGVDVSVPMLNASRDRFRAEIARGMVSIEPCDLRTSYPDAMADVTMAVLTIQFTPIEYRLKIIEQMYTHTRPGGVVLIVEKLLGESARLHDLFDAEYLAMKRRNGYTNEQVVRKKASLEGVLVSQSARFLQHTLERTGFRFVDTYYRWLNFGGWIAVR